MLSCKNTRQKYIVSWDSFGQSDDLMGAFKAGVKQVE